MKELINEITKCSYLPLTIIIIDIGKNNLNKNIINILSTSKLKKMRDNILFTSLFENHKNDIDNMIEWCLKEMVRQMLNFYELVECSPKFIQDNNLDKIKNNFEIYENSLLEVKDTNIENEKENKKDDLLNLNNWNGFMDSINLNNLENEQTNNIIENYCNLNSNKIESIKEEKNNVYYESEENEFNPHLRIKNKIIGKNSNNISNFKTTNTELSIFN